MPPVTEIAFVVGPIDPATNRGLSGVEASRAASIASSAASRLSARRLGLESVLGEHQRRTAKGVGLDDIGAGREIGTVDIEDHIRPGADEDLVATFEFRSAEIPGPELLRLQHRTGSAIEDQDALGHDRPQLVRPVRSGCNELLLRAIL